MYIIPESVPKKMVTKLQQLLHVSCTLHIHASRIARYMYLPYFTGDPAFQPRSTASRKEAVREIESPVLDNRLIHKSFMQRTL